MKISLAWLKQYVKLDLPPAEVAEILTGCGLEVESYTPDTGDVIFQIGLTPNRSDAACHVGVARDLVAILNNCRRGHAPETKRSVLMLPDVSAFKPPDHTTRMIDVVVEDTTACPRYSGLTLTNIRMAESPGWLKQRLLSVGLRPVNNIVDITNYVMMELGQPLHAFDADKIEGGIVVIRTLAAGTPFVTLDEIERTLTGTDLMICSATEPMCIAGVFGGVKSGVTETTRNVFLESACFDPVSIRKTARHHGLQTDASFRFERGTDMEMTPYALKRAALLIKEMAGGEIASGIVDVYPGAVPARTISLRYPSLDRLVGKRIPRNVVKSILEDLGIIINREEDQGLDLKIPSFKVEVTREADVIEEILRIYGYHTVEFSKEVKSSLPISPAPDPDRARDIVSDLLCSNGFHEIINNSLSSSTYYQGNPVFPEDTCVRILNPTSRELDILRQTLIFGGLESVEYNLNRKAPDLKFFEIGTVYQLTDRTPPDPLPGYHEEQRLALFLTGRAQPENWNAPGNPVDLFLLKGYLNAILTRLSIDIRTLLCEPFHSYFLSDGLVYRYDGRILMTAGMVTGPVLKQFDIRQPVLVADIHWDFLNQLARPDQTRYREMSKFPEVRRDLALLLDRGITFENIQRVAFETEKKLLRDVGLFDVYEGEQIEHGKKSYAVSFLLGDESKTLTDTVIENVMERLGQAFQEKLGARIR